MNMLPVPAVLLISYPCACAARVSHTSTGSLLPHLYPPLAKCPLDVDRIPALL